MSGQPMRRFGQLLSLLGLAVGGLLGLTMLVPLHLMGLSWLVAVGLAKLAFVGSLMLIWAGAVVQRVAIRSAERAELPPPRTP